jgi:hypothetical protein
MEPPFADALVHAAEVSPWLAFAQHAAVREILRAGWASRDNPPPDPPPGAR